MDTEQPLINTNNNYNNSNYNNSFPNSNQLQIDYSKYTDINQLNHQGIK